MDIKTGLGAVFGNKDKYEDALKGATSIYAPAGKKKMKKKKKAPAVVEVEKVKVTKKPTDMGKPSADPDETFEEYKKRTQQANKEPYEVIDDLMANS